MYFLIKAVILLFLWAAITYACITILIDLPMNGVYKLPFHKSKDSILKSGLLFSFVLPLIIIYVFATKLN